MSNKNMCRTEYIWLDGNKPTQEVRSKTRILPISENASIDEFPEWGFDGSSTRQAEGHFSDCCLRPVFICRDPLHKGSVNYIALCEVFTSDGEVHPTNKRAALRELMDKGGRSADIYIGFEQEYTFFGDGGRPLGWPLDGYPAPQGPFYCGVGAGKVYGRDIVEDHLLACLDADLGIYGVNAEVMPSQWEFQMGYRGINGEKVDPLTVSDHVWVARYLLSRISEEKGVFPSYENKPVKGDWNGAGMHANFSSKDTRNNKDGMAHIEAAIKKLADTHDKHIEVYGDGNDQRLTGAHETAHIGEFKSGVSHRGASIRIPMATAQKGYGYFEDRRPGANADPYIVSAKLIETIYFN